MASNLNSRSKVCRKPLTPTTIQAANTNCVFQRQGVDDGRIKVTIARNLDKENLDVGSRRSTGKDIPAAKSLIKSPFVLAENRFTTHTWITVLLPDRQKGKEKRVSGSSVQPHKAEPVVKNVQELLPPKETNFILEQREESTAASGRSEDLPVGPKLFSKQGEELGAISQRGDLLRADEVKTEELLAVRDEWLKKMEEELAERGKAQEELEMEFGRCLRLVELQKRAPVGKPSSLRMKRVAGCKGPVDREEDRGRTRCHGESSNGVVANGVCKTR